MPFSYPLPPAPVLSYMLTIRLPIIYYYYLLYISCLAIYSSVLSWDDSIKLAIGTLMTSYNPCNLGVGLEWLCGVIYRQDGNGCGVFSPTPLVERGIEDATLDTQNLPVSARPGARAPL